MNVQLWFARNKEQEIVSIIESKENSEYTCPLCGSEVIAKAKQSNKISSHFAHLDRSKCNGEAMIHFWMKYKFIEIGESFTIKTDKEYTYTCKSFKTEQLFSLKSGIYKPDLLIVTECGKEIVFEMANTNKKKVQDCIDKWIELNRIVVEVDIKSLIDKSKVFNALYFKGKCFNFNKRDGGYYKTIGKYKESENYDIEFARKMDWLWSDIHKHKIGILDISDLSLSLECIDFKEQVKITEIIGKKKCISFINEYLKYKSEKLYKEIIELDIPDNITLKLNYHINDWGGLASSWWGVEIRKDKGYTRDEKTVKNIEDVKLFIYS